MKKLDLSGSRKLIQILDLSGCPNIEEVILSECKELVQVYSSGFLSRLKCLWLNGCVGLRSLIIPSNILSRSLGLIVLYNCCNLKMFSVSSANTGVLSYGCSRARTRRDSIHRNILPGKLALGINQQPSSIFEKFSDTFDPLFCDELNKHTIPKDNIHLLNLKVLREGSPTLFPSLSELCWLDLSYCESLISLPIDLLKLKFLKRLYLRFCLNLEEFPEIEEISENLSVLILDETAIEKLPSSLHNLVGLEELSLHNCSMLKVIPSCIGSLSKLCKLDLTCCESLETIPSSIFKLKLTKFDLYGCSMLKTFPEILEPAENFAHINLTKTAIKELPSSLDYLVGLQTLRLNLCRDIEHLPNNIGNIKLLSKLDFSGCDKLSEIPSDIGRLSSLRELSFHESGIVSLPESLVHLSSLRSLDLTDCKRLECIPELPPFLEHLWAFDCPS